MNKLILLLIPLTLAGASCTLPEKFVAAPTASVTASTITGHHLVLDMYSNRDEDDTLTYHEQVEVWYAPNRGARIDFYSFDEAGLPFLAHRSFNDLTTGQLYAEVTAEQIFNRQYIVEDTEAPTEIKPYIDELVDEPDPQTPSMIDSILGDVLRTDYNWLADHDEPYTITQRTTDGADYEIVKTYTIDHATNEITAVEEGISESDRPYSRIVVSKRELNMYDANYFTLQGWRQSLTNPNLPLESELR